MPGTLTTSALVLRRADYGEYDRMVTLFSPEYGRIEAIARGCRRAKSALMNAVEPFTSGEYQLYFNRDRYTLEQCAITENFFELRADYDRLCHGIYYLKLLEEAVLPETPAPELFMTSLKALAYLNYGETPPELVTFAFEMHYLRMMGLAPRMDGCVRCGTPINGDCRFDIRHGGAVCSNCNSLLPKITNGARRILMKLPNTTFERFTLLEDRPDWQEAARFARAYLLDRIHMEKFAP